MKGGQRPPASVTGSGDRTPTGINVGAGSVAVVATASAAALIPVEHTAWRFAVVATVVGLFAVATGDGRATAATAALGWLVVNGLLVGRLGELTWHGSPDLARLIVLALAGTTGCALGSGCRGLCELRARWRLDAEWQAQMTDQVQMTNEEKERRDA
jgi:hypothetical protein